MEFITKPVPDKEPGRGLDKRLRREVEYIRAHKMPALSVENLRLGMAFTRSYDVTTTPVDAFSLMMDGVEVAAYAPGGAAGTLPAVVYFHGGGFIGGSVKSTEMFNRAVAEGGARVFSVEYRRAPEHKYPAALDDCYAVVKYIHKNAASLNIDPQNITVSGDSAGGGLAASCCLLDRAEGGNRIAKQALVYPSLLVGRDRVDDFSWSFELYEFEDDRELAEEAIASIIPMGDLMRELYAGVKGPILDPLIAPYREKDLRGLPPALIAVGQYDYLRPQIEAYSRRLDESGVPVKFIFYKGISHAFVDKTGKFPQAADLAKEIAAFCQMNLAKRRD